MINILGQFIKQKEPTKEKGFFYIGKQKFYWKDCDYCHKEYKGMGKLYCSYSCSKLANPTILKGEDNPSYGLFGENSISGKWIKDRSLLKKSDRHGNSAYEDWRLNIYKRDNYKCRLLNEGCSGRIEAHHIFNWIDYPELRYILTNGITLCQAHHPRKRAEEKRMIPIFQELLSVSNEIN